MIKINHDNRQRQYPLKDTAPAVEEAITHVLFSSPFAQQLMAEGITVAVDWTLIGPRSMRTLNREQRDVDQLTDILSFPAREMKDGEPTGALESYEFFGDEGAQTLFLGDLVIAPSKVEEQAHT